MTSVSSSSSVIWRELKEENAKKEIKHLSLTECNIKEIDPALNLFKGLIRLNLSNNQLSYFQGEFPFLRKLNLSCNRLQEFPQGIFPALKKLDLSHNLITKLPRMKIGGSIKHLNVSHNKIEELPIPCLDGLTLLNAEHNLLESFPQKPFADLTVIYLLGNQIKSFDVRAIPNARTLTLSLGTFRTVAAKLNLRGLKQVILESDSLTKEDEENIYNLENRNISVPFEDACHNSSNTLI